MTVYGEAAREQNDLVDNVIDRLVADPAKLSYEQSTAHALAVLVRASRFLHARPELTSTERFGIAQLLSQALMGVGVDVGRQFRAASRATLVESLHSLNRFLVKIGKRPVDDAQIEKIVVRRTSEVEAARLHTAASLGASIVQNVQRKVKESQATTMNDLLTDIEESLHREWWRVQRVSNTETAHTFNLARIDAISHTGMWQRWTELVDDQTGQPFDERVGADSIVLHGQVAMPGDTFIMPPDKRAPWLMVGDEYAQPPNRPNDRAVLLPWAAGFGAPAWVWRDGKRVDLR